MSRLCGRLEPGSTVVIIDNRYVDGSSSPIIASVRPFGPAATVTEREYYWLLSFTTTEGPQPGGD